MTILRLLKELEAAGAITRHEQRTKTGRKTSNRYVIHHHHPSNRNVAYLCDTDVASLTRSNLEPELPHSKNECGLRHGTVSADLEVQEPQSTEVLVPVVKVNGQRTPNLESKNPVKRLLTRFDLAWQRAYHEPYCFSVENGKCAKLASKLLKALPEPDLDHALERYFECDEAWVCEQRHPFSVFASQINRWRVEGKVGVSVAARARTQGLMQSTKMFLSGTLGDPIKDVIRRCEEREAQEKAAKELAFDEQYAKGLLR